MAGRRKNGEGTITRRKDGRFEGRLIIGYTNEGKPILKSVYAYGKNECLKLLRQAREEQGMLPEKLSPHMHFGNWLDFWYNHYKKANISMSMAADLHRLIYYRLIPELGHLELCKIQQSDIQQYYTYLLTKGRKVYTEKHGEGLSAAMVRLYHNAIRQSLDQAKAEGLIQVNPATGCKLPPKKVAEMRILDKDEIQRFLIQAAYEGYFELFMLELATGLRRGELLALEWSDVDLKTGELRIYKQLSRIDGQLYITTPKTKASIRTIVLPQPILEMLRRYHQSAENRWLFPSPKKYDCPREPTAVAKRMHTMLEKSGCKSVRFHDLRHTFATLALENGMDIKTLSTIIGHVSSATTLDIYSHITTEMQINAADRIDAHIGNEDLKKTAEKRKAADTDDEPAKPFEPVRFRVRHAGTGCIHKINDHLYEGRWRKAVGDRLYRFNLYAHTEEECEVLLNQRIDQMMKEIVAELPTKSDAPIFLL